MDGDYVDGSYYFYAPNKGAAVFFLLAFFVSGLLHAWQSTHYKSWLLTPLFPFCCLLFTAGFALREYGAFHYDNLNVFIASVCITYAAPPLLELQNYHILGRILYYVPYHSPIHPGRVLTTFGFLSSIIEALNGWGASYSANQSLTDKEMAAGHALIKTSLILQLLVATSFIWLAITFDRTCIKHGAMNDKLRSSLTTLYTSTGIILVRTIYRTVEYFGLAQYRFDDPNFNPKDMTPLIRYEVFFLIFEASLMLINCAMFNWRHPRRYLPKSNKIYLSQDGITEIEGPGFKDPRPFVQTIVDPFDLMGLMKIGKKHQHNFWETQPASDTTEDKGPGGPQEQEAPANHASHRV